MSDESRIRRAKEGTSSTLSEIADIAATGLQTAMFVASLVNAELKYVDTQADGVILAPGTAVVDQIDVITAIPEGTDYDQRTGRSILAKHIEFEGFVKLNFLTDPGTVLDGLTRQVRYIVLVDTQLPNNDQPSSGNSNLQLQDILQYVGDSDDCIASPQNYDNQSRYYKLLDRRFQLTVGAETTHFFKEYLELGDAEHPMHVTYLGPNAADLN